MDSYIELAKELHKRNNVKVIGICVGEVISIAPVVIQVYYNGQPICYNEFFNCKGLINGGAGVTTGELYVKEYPVNIGDRFICIGGNDNQSLYVLGKFESIKDLYIYLEEE
jgi:hypothetical protein